MSAHADRSTVNRQAATNSPASVQQEDNAGFHAVDKRPEAIAQRKLQQAVMESPRVRQLEAFQAMADNSAVKRSVPGVAPVQRVINFTATQYQNTFGGAGGLTMAQIREYTNFFVKSDLALAEGRADNRLPATGPGNVAFAGDEGNENAGEIGAIAAYKAALAAPAAAAAPLYASHVRALDGLVALVNVILRRVTTTIADHTLVMATPPKGGAPIPTRTAATVSVPNSRTAYSVTPVEGYAHENVRPTWAATYAATAGSRTVKKAAADAASPAINWATEAAAQSAFGRAAGATLLAPTTQETAPRVAADAGVARPQIKQLSWDNAKEFLPKPLLNLLFDVKNQLRGGTMVDERTPYDLDARIRNATSTVPGTLRSWHEDSTGLLPGNGRAGATPATAAAIPAGAAALHAHYTATSRTGSGTAAGGAGAPTAPVGFAEYTGAGTAHIHNIKVVLDYINSRVYLTLSHYQYWALVVNAAGEHEFIPGGSQDRDTAIDAIRAHNTVAGPPVRPYTLMNPWIEILVP